MTQVTRYYGWKSFCGVATESAAGTYGTAVAASKWFRVLDGESITYEKPTEWGMGLGSAHRTDPREGKVKVTGGLPLRLNYEGLEILLYQLFGAGKTVSAGTNYGTWTFTYADALPMGITINMNRGGAKLWKYSGCKINTAEFRFRPGEITEATFDVIGHTAATDTVESKDYTDFSSLHPVLCSHLTVKYGASDSEADETVNVKDVTLKIDNHLTDHCAVNSNHPGEPIRSEMVTISADLNMWFADYADYAYFLANEDVGLIIENEGDEITGSDPETNYALDFDIPFNRITPVADPHGSPGPLELPLHLEAYLEKADVPDEIITCTLINSNVVAIDDT